MMEPRPVAPMATSMAPAMPVHRTRLAAPYLCVCIPYVCVKCMITHGRGADSKQSAARAQGEVGSATVRGCERVLVGAAVKWRA